ncbi:OLC1v1016628C11 [Oldenlandia corymbosa var. corymbosa]|uniref:OLC1v1016628C11 n=1 Tax=Oldenlandia corymbosa var. corymbosa TaxID=529605 RepID=A0AAV1E7K5_OLDCO|nr:OLC1v1016628C11 [Oldenlandia corymbosa var. corymbosa]
MAAPSLDKYRDYLSEEELKNTTWKFGPPNYDAVNKLFEEGRAQEWPVGSLEEKLQRLLFSFEMELVHKANPDECKSVDTKKFLLSVNGRKDVTWEEIAKRGGSYNVFLETKLPEKFRVYDPEKETAESALKIFMAAFPRGFAGEILEVYSGPPVMAFKYRHWAYMEGPFKEYPATGRLVEFFGVVTLTVDEKTNKLVRMNTYLDPGQFYEGLLGASSD